MEPTEKLNESLSLKQAAELRGLKFTTLYQWCYDGKIPSTRRGAGQKAGYLVKLEDIDRFLADPRGTHTVLTVQAGGGQTPRPLKADAERGAVEMVASAAIPPTAAQASVPIVQAKRRRKTAVRMSKDFMRKCTVPEMLMITTWLLHRVESRLKDECVLMTRDTPVAAPATK